MSKYENPRVMDQEEFIEFVKMMLVYVPENPEVNLNKIPGNLLDHVKKCCSDGENPITCWTTNLSQFNGQTYLILTDMEHNLLLK